MLLIVILSLSILTFGIDKVKADSNLTLNGAEMDINFLSNYLNPLMEVLSQIDDYYSSIIYNHYDNKSYDSFTVTLRKPGYTNLTNYANNANNFQYPWDEHSSSNINDNTVGFRVDTKTIGYGNNLNSSYYTNLENYVSLFVSFFQDYLDTGVFHPNILTSQGHYVTPANYHVSYTTHFYTYFIPLFSTENVTFTPSDPSYRYTYNGEILPLSFNYPFHFYRNNFVSSYELEFDKSVSQISDFYINGANLNTIDDDYYYFKFDYIPTSASSSVYPEYNISFESLQYGSDHYVSDSGFSGLSYSCTLDGFIQKCEGSISLKEVSSSLSGSYAYRWRFSFDNYDYLDLDGRFKFYDIPISNFGVSWTDSIVGGLTRYVVNGSDIVVSPNGSYDIYLKYILNRQNVDFWVYDSDMKYFKNKLVCEDTSHYNYCKVHFDGSNSDYLRLLLYNNAIVFYSDNSDLHFNSVSNDKVVISTSDGDVTIDVSSSDDLRVDSGSPNYLNFFTNAFNFFKNIFIFIFDFINSFYNSMPLAMRYYVGLSFILLVIFIMRNFV